MLGELLPRWKYPDAIIARDKRIFDEYKHAIRQVADSTDVNAETMLAISQRVYDTETSRRESLNTRAGALLGTSAILASLVVGAGQLGLAQKQGSFGVATWVMLVLFSVCLGYIAVAVVLALQIQGDGQGSFVDPIDIARHTDAAYAVDMAAIHLSYTIANYELNNRLKYELEAAQRYLRNGIIAMSLIGLLSPLALRS